MSPVTVSGSSTRVATPKSASFAAPFQERGLSGNEDVLRLDVAVHDAALVRVIERVGQGQADPQDVAVGQLVVCLELCEGAPLDQLGDQVAGAVLLPGVVDRDDPRVLQAGGGHRLAPRPQRRGAVGGDHLDRHIAVQRLVEGLVDRAEATRAEPAAQAVAAQHEACGFLDQRHRSVGSSCSGANLAGDGGVMANAGKPPGSAAYSALTPKGDVYRVSFFDEDDEPTRRAPRPRRASPAGGSRMDPQTLWTRRAVAIGVGLLVLVFLVVVVNACQDSRRKNALRDYNNGVSDILTASDGEVGAPFFETLAQGASQSPEDLQSQVSTLRSAADTDLDRAQDLSVPGDLKNAQESLLIALELRRDGLQVISERIAEATAEPGDASDAAIESMTGQMQAFLASDVIVRSRVTPEIRDNLESSDVVADPAATSGFMTDLAWLAPEFVAEKLGTRIAGGGTGGGNGNSGAVTPGLHGNGLVSTTIDGADLSPGAEGTNTIPVGADSVTVTFENQGENTEFDVEVLVTLQSTTGAEDITGAETVDTIAEGESAEVEIPLSRPPEADLYTMDVEVSTVPGEKKADNNSSTYNVLVE